MVDAIGFGLLACIILCAIASTVTMYYAFRKGSIRLAIVAALLGASGIVASVPFRNTYQSPWLLEITVLFFTVVAVASVSQLAVRRQRNLRLRVWSMCTVAIAVCCGLAWIEFAARHERQIKGLQAWKVLESMGVNISPGEQGSNVLSFTYAASITDHDVPEIAPGIRSGILNIRAIDLKGTKLTDAGVKSLSAALPNCEIRR
jgi:hypothetical protein